LATVIVSYIRWKQSQGARFEKGQWLLKKLLRQTKDIPLKRVTPKHVSAVLDGYSIAPDTWWRNYQTLRAFFQFWMARRHLTMLPMPRARTAVPPPFRPYIYTTGELKRVIKCIEQNHDSKARRLDDLTLKTIVLFLYGTGAIVNEALNLRSSDVDLEQGLVTLRRVSSGKARTVPIGHTLRDCLSNYFAASPHKKGTDEFVFLNRRRVRVPVNTLIHNFRLLCTRAHLHQQHGISITPGMHDLRHTFAVHCLDAWLKKRKDLRTMLPVLSSYMGHVMWRSTEQYLRLVPGRFWKQLSRLGPIETSQDSTIKLHDERSKIRPALFSTL
jgi:integrase/recombinase XerD